MPEARDTDFTWDDFVRRNNDELVATWGNLANRVLTFAYRHFDGACRQPGALGRRRPRHPGAGRGGLPEWWATCWQPVQVEGGAGGGDGLAREANVYLDQKAPWFQIKQDRQAAATTVYVTLRVIDNLKMLLAPFLPFTGQRLHEMLGYDGQLFGRQYVETFTEATRSHEALCYDGSQAIGTWQPSRCRPARRCASPPRCSRSWTTTRWRKSWRGCWVRTSP